MQIKRKLRITIGPRTSNILYFIISVNLSRKTMSQRERTTLAFVGIESVSRVNKG